VKPTVLVTGSAGQIGSELIRLLRDRYGPENVVAGIFETREQSILDSGPCEVIDVRSRDQIEAAVRKHHIDTIYHLAAVLSAVGEKDPQHAWDVNMQGLKNVLDVSKERGVTRIFWPSSIAVFGPDAPKKMTPQDAPLNPTTMYGVTKVAGELLCNYYCLKYGLDIRCVRYPGLISNSTKPGGGTTDYAVEIFYDAVKGKSYQCFVRANTVLPMMYMPDALRAAVELMEADAKIVRRHTGYNLAAMSFSAGELAAEIARLIPGFRCTYVPDFRQAVADGWPESISDLDARRDWGWVPRYDLGLMTEDMVLKLSKRLRKTTKKG
jgi:nucleoside-diphosphate-sugar epimerase